MLLDFFHIQCLPMSDSLEKKRKKKATNDITQPLVLQEAELLEYKSFLSTTTSTKKNHAIYSS